MDQNKFSETLESIIKNVEDSSTERILHFLSRATSELGTTLDWHETLIQLCEIMCPDLAEHCSVWWVGQDGELSEQKKANINADITDVIETMNEKVMKSGISRIENQEGLSILTVPMRLKNKVAGLITLINFNSSFKKIDSDIAEELAYRAAMVLDHAQIFKNLKEAEEHLLKMRALADEASETKSMFLANMSHEIRTPLTAILGFMDIIISNQEQINMQTTDLADRVRANGTHLLRLIDQILDLSKVESGKIEIFSETVQLGGLLKDIYDTMYLAASRKNIKFEFKIEASIPVQIKTDPTRLKQILINVIGNAIKFTEHGKVSLTIGFDPKMNQLRFKIADTGIGLTPEQRERIFHPYMQGDLSHSRRFGGTGLGLTLSRKFAQHMNGNIVLIDSVAEEGTVFLVTIDSGCGEHPELTNILWKNEKKLKLVAESNISLEGIKILLAEDSPDNQMIINLLLTKVGAEVDIASDGIEALNMALAKKYDVILMDIQLPYMNGHMVCKKLRDSKYAGPVIALTAHALKKERDESMQSGCNEHLTKPIDKNLLVRTIKSFI